MYARWVDLQVNGYAGVDFNAPGLTQEAVRAVTDRLAADGTAAFLPTLVTGDPEMLLGTIRAVVAARRRYPGCERAIRGFFLEGPFISPEPGAVGTHPVEVCGARSIVCVVPDARKADAVAAAVDGPLTPLCPSSILRTHPDCTLYLDPPAAAKLKA